MALNSIPNINDNMKPGCNINSLVIDHKSNLGDGDTISESANESPQEYDLLRVFKSDTIELPENETAKKNPIFKKYCKICRKSYMKNEELKNHSCDHTDDKQFYCNLCDRKFRLKSFLNLHALTHVGKKPFRCILCNRDFTQKSSLNTHRKQFHESNVKMYKCDECTKKFKLKYFLNMHIRTHTGEKPFKCNLCDSRFTQKSSLNTHVKQFHMNSVPMYDCMYCDKKFLRETMLNKHILSHN